MSARARLRHDLARLPISSTILSGANPCALAYSSRPSFWFAAFWSSVETRRYAKYLLAAAGPVGVFLGFLGWVLDWGVVVVGGNPQVCEIPARSGRYRWCFLGLHGLCFA